MKKILFFPPYDTWYLGRNAEYFVRYLSDEFEMVVADVPYPPYEEFLSRFPTTHPLQRSPDDYDLFVPLLATHWGVIDKDAYRQKTALIWYQPNEGHFYDDLAGIAACTPLAEKSLEGKPHHKVRWGVDLDIFKPLHHKRANSPLRVGMVGNLTNPRRMTRVVAEALRGVSGVKLVLFVGTRPKSFHDLELIGCTLDEIESGEKDSIGLANIYNSLDVLIRCDSDPGYSFPVLEAAACGVPVIATNSGIDHEVCQAGGGILIDGDREYYQHQEKEVGQKVRDAVIYLRENPDARLTMGINAWQFVRFNYSWDKLMPVWREFFRSCLQ